MESLSHSKEGIQRAEKYMKSINGKVITVPYYNGQSSSKIKELISMALPFFEKNNDPFQKEWSVFNKLFNIKNVSRKECLILPFTCAEHSIF